MYFASSQTSPLSSPSPDITCSFYLPTPDRNATDYLFSSSLRLRLGASSTLHLLCLRAVDNVVRNPALIIRLLWGCASRRCSSIGTNARRLILGTRRCTMRACCGTLSAITLASALCLWEEGFDPGIIDEVYGSSETCEEEQIQEDSNYRLALKEE
jgi:hypothetical protein